MNFLAGDVSIALRSGGESAAWLRYAIFPFPPRSRLLLSEAWGAASDRPDRFSFAGASSKFCAEYNLPALTGLRADLFDALHRTALHRQASAMKSDFDVAAFEVLATYVGASILALSDEAILRDAALLIEQRCSGVSPEKWEVADSSKGRVELRGDLLGTWRAHKPPRPMEQAFEGVGGLVFDDPSRALRGIAEPFPDIFYHAPRSKSVTAAWGQKAGEARSGFLSWIFGKAPEQPPPVNPAVQKKAFAQLAWARRNDFEESLRGFWAENAKLEREGKQWLSRSVLDQRLRDVDSRHAELRDKALFGRNI